MKTLKKVIAIVGGLLFLLVLLFKGKDQLKNNNNKIADEKSKIKDLEDQKNKIDHSMLPPKEMEDYFNKK